MEAVEDGERSQDPDHVFGFLDGASGPKLIVSGKSFGKRAGVLGFLAVRSPVGFETPVQARICRPGGAGLSDPPTELGSRIGAGLGSGRTIRARGNAGRKRLEQALLGAKLVVDRDPRHTGALRHLAYAGGRAVLGDHLAGGPEDGGPGTVDLALAQAQAVGSRAHPIRLTDSMFNQFSGCFLIFGAPNTYHRWL
jgi:hypothetical protein